MFAYEVPSLGPVQEVGLMNHGIRTDGLLDKSAFTVSKLLIRHKREIIEVTMAAKECQAERATLP